MVQLKFVTLSPTQQQNVSTWIKSFDIKGANDRSLKWVSQYHDYIAQRLEQKYDNINTKKPHFNTLAQIVKSFKLKDEYEEYSKIATDLNKEQVEINKEQTVIPKRVEHYITYNDIIKRREELKQEYYYKKDPARIIVIKNGREINSGNTEIHKSEFHI